MPQFSAARKGWFTSESESESESDALSNPDVDGLVATSSARLPETSPNPRKKSRRVARGSGTFATIVVSTRISAWPPGLESRRVSTSPT